jgi:hypothetical protein
MISNDLLRRSGVYPILAGMHAGRTFRQRLGDRLLVEREQVKKWSRLEVAKRLEIDAGTIKRMEEAGNAGLDFYEKYARELGLTLEQVCRDALSEPLEVPFSSRAEVQALAATIEELTAANKDYPSLLMTFLEGQLLLRQQGNAGLPPRLRPDAAEAARETLPSTSPPTEPPPRPGAWPPPRAVRRRSKT